MRDQGDAEMGTFYDAFKALQLRPIARQDEVARLIDGFLAELFHATRSWQRPSFGVYLYGSVGSGKSMLMGLVGQLMIESMNVEANHFLPFMQDIRLRIRDRGGVASALQHYNHHSLLLIDEFQVNDIADAMILQSVLLQLDHNGASLMCTGNKAPDELYMGGIQRASFLPCIEFIKQRMHVWSISIEDQRKQQSGKALAKGAGGCCFVHPINELTEEFIMHAYSAIPFEEQSMHLEVLGRRVTLERTRGPAVLLDHSWLDGAGPADYVALCGRFRCVFLLGMRQIRTRDDARRFIDFIDICYERRVVLWMQLECPVEQLFHTPHMGWHEEALAKDRTQSRLLEMQSWHNR